MLFCFHTIIKPFGPFGERCSHECRIDCGKGKYMGITGLGMYSNANYYYKSVTKSRSSSLSNLSEDFVNEEISKDDPLYDFKEDAKKQ